MLFMTLPRTSYCPAWRRGPSHVLHFFPYAGRQEVPAGEVSCINISATTYRIEHRLHGPPGIFTDISTADRVCALRGFSPIIRLFLL
jgi:hypothetical protein